MSSSSRGKAESNDSSSKKAEKPERPPVDNATLAVMLRDSADIVERGGFDVLLYHALQDFRTYYKAKLPKRKEKGEKKKKTKIISKTTTHIPADHVGKTVKTSSGGSATTNVTDATITPLQERKVVQTPLKLVQ